VQLHAPRYILHYHYRYYIYFYPKIPDTLDAIHSLLLI